MKNSRGATIYRTILSETGAVTDKELVPTVAGKDIYIHQLYLDTATNNNTITLKSGGTAISPDFFFASKGDIMILPGYNEIGWFKADTNLTITSAEAFTGFLMYTQEQCACTQRKELV